jgi:hypothetical protein
LWFLGSMLQLSWWQPVKHQRELLKQNDITRQCFIRKARSNPTILFIGKRW